MPRLCEFYPGIYFTTEEKARKILSQGKKNFSQVKKNLSHRTVYILPKTPTRYKTLTNTYITKYINIIRINMHVLSERDDIRRYNKNIPFCSNVLKLLQVIFAGSS